MGIVSARCSLPLGLSDPPLAAKTMILSRNYDESVQLTLMCMKSRKNMNSRSNLPLGWADIFLKPDKFPNSKSLSTDEQLKPGKKQGEDIGNAKVLRRFAANVVFKMLCPWSIHRCEEGNAQESDIDAFDLRAEMFEEKGSCRRRTYSFTLNITLNAL